MTHSSAVYNFYVNGKLIASGVGHSYQSSNITLKIGGRDYSTARDFYKGEIDDVEIYSSILDSTTVQSMYKGYASEINSLNGSTNTLSNSQNQQNTGNQAINNNSSNNITQMVVEATLVIGLIVSISLLFIYKKKSKIERQNTLGSKQHSNNGT